MNKRSKSTMTHEQLSRVRLSRKFSERRTTFSTELPGRKGLSKVSNLGSVGSRVFFHRRGDRIKIPKYQNTYRLEPFNSFHAETVDKIVRDVMENKLGSLESYQPDQMSKLCLEIVADVTMAVERKDYDRYKIVTQASIVQRLDQSVHSSFQYLWDVDRDNYSYYVFENNHIYAWCCVFGMYYE